MSESSLVIRGCRLLANIFAELAGSIPSDGVVVPLSGGMDSRAVLGGLLQHIPRSHIRTVTVGVPGALDYELGQMVARSAGVDNIAIDLNHIDWTADDLVAYAQMFPFPVPVIDGYLYSQVFRPYGNSALYASGFLGDPLSGARLPLQQSMSWHEAKLRFIDQQDHSGSPFGSVAYDYLPTEPLADVSILNYDDQLDLLVRQRSFIRPVVLLRNYDHLVPFLDSRWIRFMLSLPLAMRSRQRLYKRILSRAYPQLFELPLKNMGGLSLESGPIVVGLSKVRRAAWRLLRRIRWWNARPSVAGVNYIDLATGYRSNQLLRAVADHSLRSLTLRDVLGEVDIGAVWLAHQEKRTNAAAAISSLIALEMFFAAESAHTRAVCQTVDAQTNDES